MTDAPPPLAPGPATAQGIAMRPPRSALLLGYGGLLPPLAAIGLKLMTGGNRYHPFADLLVLLGLVYGALILSFLGGIWWGIAAARLAERGRAALLAAAVVPTLVALAIMALLPFNTRAAGALLGLAIVATLLVDRRLARAGLVPGWWLALRVPLSLGLGTAMIVLGIVAR